jgi:hypothetical protein
MTTPPHQNKNNIFVFQVVLSHISTNVSGIYFFPSSKPSNAHAANVFDFTYFGRHPSAHGAYTYCCWCPVSSKIAIKLYDIH